MRQQRADMTSDALCTLLAPLPTGAVLIRGGNIAQHPHAGMRRCRNRDGTDDALPLGDERMVELGGLEHARLMSRSAWPKVDDSNAQGSPLSLVFKTRRPPMAGTFHGRAARIRTEDLRVPNATRYQAAVQRVTCPRKDSNLRRHVRREQGSNLRRCGPGRRLSGPHHYRSGTSPWAPPRGIEPPPSARQAAALPLSYRRRESNPDEPAYKVGTRPLAHHRRGAGNPRFEPRIATSEAAMFTIYTNPQSLAPRPGTLIVAPSCADAPSSHPAGLKRRVLSVFQCVVSAPKTAPAGVIRSGICASTGVRSPLPRLHGRQAATVFNQVFFPPRDCG